MEGRGEEGGECKCIFLASFFYGQEKNLLRVQLCYVVELLSIWVWVFCCDVDNARDRIRLFFMQKPKHKIEQSKSLFISINQSVRERGRNGRLVQRVPSSLVSMLPE